MTDAQAMPTSRDFDRRFLKPGAQLLMLPIGQELAVLIGTVAAQWGAFEGLFAQMGRTLAEAAGDDERFANQKGFARRIVLVREYARLVKFSKNDAGGKALLETILRTAADLHWRRNIVVHGEYGFTWPPHSSHAHARATGVHNGREVTIKLDHDTLTRLWHDIAHLGGEMHRLGTLTGEVEGGLGVIADDRLLELFKAYDGAEAAAATFSS